MRSVICRFFEHDSTNFSGLVPLIHLDWFSKGNYLPGQLGHELIEHGTKETGSVEDELTALGTLLYVRDFCEQTKEDKSPYYSPVKSHAADLENTFRDNNFQPIPICIPRIKPVDSDDLVRIKEFVTETWQLIPDMCGGFEEEEFELINNQLNLANTINWLTYGFSVGMRRYKGDRKWQAWEMIKKLDKECVRYVNDFNPSPETLSVVSYSLKTGYLSIKPKGKWNEY